MTKCQKTIRRNLEKDRNQNPLQLDGNGAWTRIVFKPWTEKLTTSLILGYADYSLSFEIHTDASTSTCSSTLYQKQDNINRVIAYASRSLSKSGKNYPFHKLELPALKWAVCVNLETTPKHMCSQQLNLMQPVRDGLQILQLLELYEELGELYSNADGLRRIPDSNQTTRESFKAISNSTNMSPYVKYLPVTMSSVEKLSDI